MYAVNIVIGVIEVFCCNSPWRTTMTAHGEEFMCTYIYIILYYYLYCIFVHTSLEIRKIYIFSLNHDVLIVTSLRCLLRILL